MSNKVTLSLHDWSQMFACISRDNNAIFWITRIKSKTARYEQVYLNNAYKYLTGYSAQDLFDNQAVFDSYLISENKEKLIASWTTRHFENESTDHTSIYCLKKNNGEKLWLRDTFYTIYNEHHQPLFGAGIAIDITNDIETLHDNAGKHYQELHTEVFQDYAHRLQDVLKFQLAPNCSQPKPNAKLSRREHQCALLLLEGRSTKEIAQIIHLSPRTVEVYISRLRARFGSKNKFHLTKHLMESGLL